MSEDRIGEAVVEKIVEGGLGLARNCGRTILLPLAAPGERVRYEIVRERGDRVDARVVAVQSPSPARVEAPCPVYGVCGGCQIQHLSPAAQLEAKRAIALETLARIGRIDAPGPVPITPSPAAFGYRHRATFHIDWSGAGPVAGFHRARSHEVVGIAACPLLSDGANRILGEVRESLLPAVRALRPDRVQIVRAEDGRFDVAFAGGRPPEGDGAAALVRAARARAAPRALYWEKAPGEFATLFEEGPPLSYRMEDAGGSVREIFFDLRVFTQANLDANRELALALRESTADMGRFRLLDLHAGCGNLSIPLLPRASEAHLVDTSATALGHAERGALAAHGRLNLTAGRAEEVSARLAAEGARFDLVLLDPPRQGAPGVVRPLATIRPARILYVSCNVPTLARDLALFLRAGFEIASLSLFDFYPQTAHIEALADLRPR